jgi:hypothetical protein
MTALQGETGSGAMNRGTALAGRLRSWWSLGSLSEQDSQVIGVVAGSCQRWPPDSLVTVGQVLPNTPDHLVGVFLETGLRRR